LHCEKFLFTLWVAWVFKYLTRIYQSVITYSL